MLNRFKQLFGLGADRREKDGPLDEPYSVYTRDFDITVRAERVPAIVSSGTDSEKDKLTWNASVQAERESAALERSKECGTASHALRDYLSARPSNVDTAIILLIDQSGSTKDHFSIEMAAAVRILIQGFGAAKIATECLGFSTHGWHGGKPRQKWLAEGKPKRPRRLAALLHIIYKGFDELELDAARWSIFLHSDILRENVDGEALLWADERLRGHTAQQKILLIFSDGAPVDDATMAANGPFYLSRHLMKTIEAIEADPNVKLGAIGLGYDVSGWYRVQSRAGDAADIISATTAVLQAIDAENNANA